MSFAMEYVPDGTPLLFMPSTEFYYLSDEDLGAVIAYIESASPIDNDLPISSLSLTGRVAMTLVPAITFIPAELIPHAAERPVALECGITRSMVNTLPTHARSAMGLPCRVGPFLGFHRVGPLRPI